MLLLVGVNVRFMLGTIRWVAVVYASLLCAWGYYSFVAC